MAMAGDARSWFGKVGLFGCFHLATQLAVLLPVIVIAGLTAMLSAPTRATSQSVERGASVTAPAKQAEEMVQQDTALANPLPGPTAVTPETASGEQVTANDPPAINGLSISSQSWRRGGLGSRALVTFTLRNTNDYAVKDIEIACAFTRRDGSHLTSRQRVIPDAMVNKRSRKTFAQVHIGFVNINANKAKCALVSASRV